jgi:PAS domain S-box-containing protein
MAIKFLNSEAMGRLPWFLRFLLGCCMASGALAVTTTFTPLSSFPLLLAFPTVVFAAWFLGMWGAAGGALVDILMVNAFLTRTQLHVTAGTATQEFRLAMFLTVSLLLGWSMRRLSRQRAELSNHELQQKLALAQSERRLAEERARASEELRDRDEVLQLAMRANGMGLWVWDLQKGVIQRSDEVFRLVGCAPGEFGSDPDEWRQYVHPDDLEGFKETVARAKTEGRDYHMQYRVRWADGSVHWLESQCKSQRDIDGRVTRIVGVMSDITHRKHAEEAMLRAEKLAVAGRLAASVAHEINNPLEAVANMLYLISHADSTEVARKYASDALSEQMRISLIAQSTLKFHRQTGTPKVTILSEVVGSVLTLFRGKLEAMEIAVDVQTGREVPIACMPSETQQIFANLIANAIEAMQNNGRLLIRLRPSREWGDRSIEGMRVTVCDTGAGIDRATMRRIFEPFFTTKPDTGTGLGLWVVAQLVERHKGRVQVWSSQRPGASGTVFSVFLPTGDETKRDNTGNGVATMDAKGTQRHEPERLQPGLFFQHQEA